MNILWVTSSYSIACDLISMPILEQQVNTVAVVLKEKFTL